MSTADPQFEAPSADDDRLPAVAPPATGFFVQLFVMPALIVFGIIIVYFLFGRLSGERSIDEYVRNLESSQDPVRWKAALDLAWLLRQNSTHVHDAALAQKLADSLDKVISKSRVDENEARYGEYLAGALGSFSLPTGAPVLRRSLRADLPTEIRRAAYISLAKLAERLGDLKDPGIAADVAEQLTDNNTEIRELACFALGFLGDRESIGALSARLEDSTPAVRYNAAAAIARWGGAQCVPVLREMLDPAVLAKKLLASDNVGETAPDRELVAATVLQGLTSTRRLRKANPKADLTPLLTAITTLTNNENQVLAVEATNVLREIQGK